MTVAIRPSAYPQRLLVDIQEGHAVIGSDAHIWPGVPCTGLRAFHRVIRMLRPKLICLNGDVFDGAAISRHPKISWETIPSVHKELEECQARLEPIEQTAQRLGHVLTWNLGNHDARFETFLANKVPEYKRIPGVHLKDHFPAWQPAWSTWINFETDPVVIKHRPGGSDMGRNLENSVRRAGTHLVCGHTHRGQVVRVSNYRGDLFGVNAGMLAPKYGPQFVAYTEDAAQDWSTSFTVLTFRYGKLLWPEMVHVTDEAGGGFTFRGERYYV